MKPTAPWRPYNGKGRIPRRAAACVAAGLLALGMTAAPALAYTWDQKSKAKSDRKKETQEFALLFGTVFDENGRLVRGAEIRVRQKEGKRQWEARTDTQGEFAVRLPPVSDVYIVEATAPGFSRETKEVSFVADERQDIVFRISRQIK